jgi:hypothetical protein
LNRLHTLLSRLGVPDFGIPGDQAPESRNESAARQNLQWPEREGDTAPIELTYSIGKRVFALEHTSVEPFERQIELEAKTGYDVTPAMPRAA